MKYLVLLGGLALAALFSACRDENDGARPTATAQASPSVSATAPGTASPTHPAGEVSRVAPVLEKHTYTAGETPSGEAGLAFLDPATGNYEAWSEITPAVPGSSMLVPSSDGSLIWMAGLADDPVSYLTVRASGATYELPRAYSPMAPVMTWPRVELTQLDGQKLRLFVLDLGSSQPVITPAPLDLPPGAYGPVVSPDGSHAVVKSGTDLLLLDTATLNVTKVTTLPSLSAGIEPMPGNLGFRVFTVPDGSRSVPAQWYSWDGKLVNDAVPSGSVSPDGKLIATTRAITPTSGSGYDYPAANMTTVHTIDGNKPVLQVLGGSIAGWAADSRSLAIGIGMSDVQVVALDGTVGRSIEGKLPIQTTRFSPTNADLVVTTAGVLSLRTGAIVPFPAPAGSWITTNWTANGSLAVFTWSEPPGKDWGNVSEILPLKASLPPFPDPAVVAVQDAGDCLNLREKASTNSAVLGCYPDGTKATITLAPDPLYDKQYDKDGKGPAQVGGTRIIENAAASSWLHLEFADGKSGWASAKYLGWP